MQDADKPLFHKAKALKAGLLRFPETHNTLVKNKAFLEKTGDWLSACPDYRLTVLIKQLVKNEPHEDNPRVTFTERYVLWSWSDSDDIKALARYLRTVPDGMCPHTRLEVFKRDFKESLRTRNEPIYDTSGVCSRSECTMLKTEDLLLTYLNGPMKDDKLRAELYFVLGNKYKSFSSTFLCEQFETEPVQSATKPPGEMLVRAIQSKTLRWQMNSNGLRSFAFSIVSYQQNTVERLKNNLRPLALQAKRQDPFREEVYLTLSSEDRDTLQSWNDVLLGIFASVKCNSNRVLNSAFADSFKKASRGMDKSDASEANYAHIANEKVSMFRVDTIGNQFGGDGTKVQLSTGNIYSNLSVKELFSHIVTLVNESDSSFRRRFDRYVFGGALSDENEGAKLSIQDTKQVQVFIDPPTKTNTLSELYGFERQSLLIRAIKTDRIQLENWLAKDVGELGFGFGNMLANLGPIRKLLNYVSEWSAESNAGIKHSNSGGELFGGVNEINRTFNLKKIYFENAKDNKSSMNNFCVAYLSVPEEKCFEEKPGKKLSQQPSSLTANIQQVFIKVERNEEYLKLAEKMKILGVDEFAFEKMFNNNNGVKAKYFLLMFFYAIQKNSNLLIQTVVTFYNAEIKALEDKVTSTGMNTAQKDFVSAKVKEINEACEKELKVPDFKPSVFGRNNSKKSNVDNMSVPFLEEVMFHALTKNGSSLENSRSYLIRTLNYLSKALLSRTFIASQVRSPQLKIVQLVKQVLESTNKLVVAKQSMSVLKNYMILDRVYEAEEPKRAQSDWHNVACAAFIEAVDTCVSSHRLGNFATNVLLEAINNLSQAISESLNKGVLSLTVMNLIPRMNALIQDFERETTLEETINRLSDSQMTKTKENIKFVKGKYESELRVKFQRTIESVLKLNQRAASFTTLEQVFANTESFNMLKGSIIGLKLPYIVIERDDKGHKNYKWQVAHYNAVQQAFEVMLFNERTGKSELKVMKYEEMKQSTNKVLSETFNESEVQTLSSVLLIDTFYEQHPTGKKGVDDDEIVKYWREHDFIQRDNTETQEYYAKLNETDSLYSKTDSLFKFWKKRLDKLRRLAKEAVSNPSLLDVKVMKQESHLKKLFAQLNGVQSVFDKCQDSETKISVEVIGSAAELFSKETVRKFPDLKGCWNRSIFSDIQVGLQNVRKDRKIFNDAQIDELIALSDRLVNNEKLKLHLQKDRVTIEAENAEKTVKKMLNNLSKTEDGTGQNGSDLGEGGDDLTADSNENSMTRGYAQKLQDKVRPNLVLMRSPGYTI